MPLLLSLTLYMSGSNYVFSTEQKLGHVFGMLFIFLLIVSKKYSSPGHSTLG